MKKKFQSKLNGVQHIKTQLTRQSKNPNAKYISLDLLQAQEIMEELNSSKAPRDDRSNSLKASALLLCITPKDLAERLDAPNPKQLMNELSRLKTKVETLKSIGDEMVLIIADKDYSLAKEWNSAKNL